MSKIKIKKSISLNLEICISHDISYPEWILCEQIQFLSVRKGYCYAKRETLADALKMTTRGLQKMIARLVDRGLLERHGKNNLIVTEKWLEFQEIPENKHEQSSDKDSSKHEQSSPPKHEQSSPPTIKTAISLEEKNTKKEKLEYRLLIDKLQRTAKRKSKCQYTEKGYEAYLQIKDKSQIAENYLKHQKLKEQYAQTIANFLLDYEANVEELQDPTKHNRDRTPAPVGTIAWEYEQRMMKQTPEEVFDTEVIGEVVE